MKLVCQLQRKEEYPVQHSSRILATAVQVFLYLSYGSAGFSRILATEIEDFPAILPRQFRGSLYFSYGS